MTAEAERIARRRARAGGRLDNDYVSSAVEHRLAALAATLDPDAVAGMTRHAKAAWMRYYYPDMVDETRQQVRLDLNIPLRSR